MSACTRARNLPRERRDAVSRRSDGMLSRVNDLLAFLRDSPTPFHAVASARARLDAAGFHELRETDEWRELAGGGYYVITAETNLVAFVLPSERAQRTSFRIVGAHTDSP